MVTLRWAGEFQGARKSLHSKWTSGFPGGLLKLIFVRSLFPHVSMYCSLYPGTAQWTQFNSRNVLLPRGTYHLHLGFQLRSPGRIPDITHENGILIIVRILVLPIVKTVDYIIVVVERAECLSLTHGICSLLWFLLKYVLSHLVKSLLESQDKPGCTEIRAERQEAAGCKKKWIPKICGRWGGRRGEEIFVSRGAEASLNSKQ